MMPELLNNTDRPLVSVVIPCYNHEKYVEKAIQSVLNQTYNNIQLIVIDDGSKDKSFEKIKLIANKVDFIHETHENIGLSATLNYAINNYANGQFITFLASDDFYESDRITKLVSFLLKNSEFKACYSNGYIINDFNQKIGIFSKKYPIPISSNVFRELLVENWIPMLGMIFCLKSLKEVGLFNENFKVEDYEVLLRFSKRFKIGFVDDILFHYRLHQTNFSNNQVLMNQELKKIKYQYHNMFEFDSSVLNFKNKNIFKSLFFFRIKNLDLYFRLLIRKIQKKGDLDFTSYIDILKRILDLIHLRIKSKLLIAYYKLLGMEIGKNVRIYGKIKCNGFYKNIKINSNVNILGRVFINSGYSKSKKYNKIIFNSYSIIEKNSSFITHNGTIIIGEKSFIGENCHLQGNIIVGESSMIASNCYLYASNHNFCHDNIPFINQGENFKGIIISENTWIGTNSVVLDGVIIAKNSIIGAGSVVNKNNSENSIFAGNPNVFKKHIW